MEKTLFVLLSLVLTFGSLNAREPRIITVDNKYPSMGEYTTIQAAHDAAIPGDTIYVYPSSIAYSGFNVSKKLTIIGSGWPSIELDLQGTSVNGEINLQPGSDYSVLMSISGKAFITIDANNVTIKKNYLDSRYCEITNITIKSNHTGTIISQNILMGSDWMWIILIDNQNEVLISNNFLYSPKQWTPLGGEGGKGIVGNASEIDLIIDHNHFDVGHYPCEVNQNAIVSSNYFWINGNVDGRLYNNFSSNCCFANGLNNVNNVNPSDIFVNSWHIKPGSIAEKAGKDGTDIGIYGGQTPFVDGGLPDIPLIYELKANIVGSKQNGLKVKFKAKSNKE